MDKKQSEDEQSSAPSARQTLQSEEVALPGRTDSEHGDTSRVHLEYQEQAHTAADAQSRQEPLRRVPPTPLGDAVEDAEPSPPIDWQDESRSQTDADVEPDGDESLDVD